MSSGAADTFAAFLKKKHSAGRPKIPQLAAIILMLAPRKAGRIDAALAPANSCRGACASNLAVDKEVNTRGLGGRVEQRRPDGKNLQTQKKLSKN